MLQTRMADHMILIMCSAAGAVAVRSRHRVAGSARSTAEQKLHHVPGKVVWPSPMAPSAMTPRWMTPGRGFGPRARRSPPHMSAAPEYKPDLPGAWKNSEDVLQNLPFDDGLALGDRPESLEAPHDVATSTDADSHDSDPKFKLMQFLEHVDGLMIAEQSSRPYMLGLLDALEPLNPTAAPAKASRFAGSWELKYRSRFQVGPVYTPTRVPTLPVEVLQFLPGPLKSWKGLTDVSVTITKYAGLAGSSPDFDVVSTLTFALPDNREESIFLKSRLHPEAPDRFKETFSFGECRGFEFLLPFSRRFLVSYLDDDLMVIRDVDDDLNVIQDDGAKPEVLVRKPSETRQE